MKKTLELAQNYKEVARSLDTEVVAGRAPYILKNLIQLEGINRRSTKYVYRLAGFDLDRKSRSEQMVEWFAATAIENPEQALKFKAFWQGLFDYADNNLISPQRHFWTTEEETNDLLSQLRLSVLKGDKIEARRILFRIMVNAQEMLRQIDTDEMDSRIILP